MRPGPRTWRRISRTSRKPAVVNNPVRAPLRSSSALVATVVPWETEVSAAGGTRARTSRPARPSTKARAGSAGVEGTFALWTSPVSSSTRTKSVKVPPVSMPTRQAMGGPDDTTSAPRSSGQPRQQHREESLESQHPRRENQGRHGESDEEAAKKRTPGWGRDGRVTGRSRHLRASSLDNDGDLSDTDPDVGGQGLDSTAGPGPSRQRERHRDAIVAPQAAG